MPDITGTITGPSDADLISAVRTGDTAAYGQLFDRHRDAATRLASHLVRGPDSDDLVSEAFVRVLTVLQSGKGPDESFRAYLLTAIRRLQIDRIRAAKRVRPTGDEAELDRAVEFVDTAEMRFERSAAAAAFAGLPERWQLVLWHLDVEGHKPADIAPLLAMSPNGVSALAYRAREGLRQSYLQGQLAPALHQHCARTTGMLGAYVRNGLSSRDTGAVEEHLDECSRCTGLYLELTEINSNLAGILGPALLGTAAAGYLAGAGSAAVGAAGVLGLKAIAGQAARLTVEPVKSLATAAGGAGTQGVVAAAVVATVAAAGTVAVVTDFGTKPSEAAAARSLPRASDPPSSKLTPATPPSHSAGKSDTGKSDAHLPQSPLASVSPALPDPALAVPTPEPIVLPVTPAPKPAPRPKPQVVPTDYGIGAVTITNDEALLQRRFTIPVTATTNGPAVARSVTLRFDFRSSVIYAGTISAGWDCQGAIRNQPLRTLTCTSKLGAGQGATFVTTVRGLLPAGTVTVTAKDDPRPANNSVPFTAGLWLPL